MNTRTTIIFYNGSYHENMEILKSKGLESKNEAIRRRILRGWSAQRAIDTPINKYSK